MKVNLELLEKQMVQKMENKIDNLEWRMKTKVKKRVKTKEIKDFVSGKLSIKEFNF